MNQQVEFEMFGKQGSGFKEICSLGVFFFFFFSGWQPWEIYWDFGEEGGINLKHFQGVSEVTSEISRSLQANSMWNKIVE